MYTLADAVKAARVANWIYLEMRREQPIASLRFLIHREEFMNIAKQIKFDARHMGNPHSAHKFKEL